MVLHKKGERIFKFPILVCFDVLTRVENKSNSRTGVKEAKITAIKDKRRFVSYNRTATCSSFVQKEKKINRMEDRVSTLAKTEKVLEQYERTPLITIAYEITSDNKLVF